MTVSRDISCDVAAVDAVRARAIATLGKLTPREAPDLAASRPVAPSPSLASSEAVGAWVRGTVAAVRRAIDDGSLHHHRPQEVPHGRSSLAADVVRSWAAGHDTDTQRRLCGVCSPETASAR